MTADEARAFLARITYKPGSSLELVDEGSEFWVRMHRHLDDSTAPGKSIHLHFAKALSVYDLPMWREFDLLQHVKDLCVYSERHEIAEWLKLDGKCIDEPHPERALPLSPLAALDAMPGIQERPATLGGLTSSHELV